MAPKIADPFVSTAWLAERIGDPDIAVVDASWYLPTENRDARAEFLDAHIPGAVFFDIDAVADTSVNLPHMLPAPGDFADKMGKLGISDKQTIVIYDTPGLFSAPRAWWTFRTMGAGDVKILAGGFSRWRSEDRPVQSGEPRPNVASFTTNFHSSAVHHWGDLKANLASHARQVVDARPAPRFKGEAPEPRPGLASGHIPGSLNIPVGMVSSNNILKSQDELRELFAGAGIDLTQPLVTSCGSGVTAATLLLALETAGARDVALYDGSWAEWGSRKDSPVEK